ncbi:Hypothetical protein CINCED_3A006679 [Cinara cedri]|uniref:Uncharacterized protein n=1 Tax=Cinara cedri TaxID=506608 RepID=A0A5E4MEL9_9HEMI|nr:Hypothetical protein CINCED_3A006679 [Cinara cedri]
MALPHNCISRKREYKYISKDDSENQSNNETEIKQSQYLAATALRKFKIPKKNNEKLNNCNKSNCFNPCSSSAVETKIQKKSMKNLVKHRKNEMPISYNALLSMAQLNVEKLNDVPKKLVNNKRKHNDQFKNLKSRKINDVEMDTSVHIALEIDKPRSAETTLSGTNYEKLPKINYLSIIGSGVDFISKHFKLLTTSSIVSDDLENDLKREKTYLFNENLDLSHRIESVRESAARFHYNLIDLIDEFSKITTSCKLKKCEDLLNTMLDSISVLSDEQCSVETTLSGVNDGKLPKINYLRIIESGIDFISKRFKLLTISSMVSNHLENYIKRETNCLSNDSLDLPCRIESVIESAAHFHNNLLELIDGFSKIMTSWKSKKYENLVNATLVSVSVLSDEQCSIETTSSNANDGKVGLRKIESNVDRMSKRFKFLTISPRVVMDF